jgi:hypothetical protein
MKPPEVAAGVLCCDAGTARAEGHMQCVATGDNPELALTLWAFSFSGQSEWRHALGPRQPPA